LEKLLGNPLSMSKNTPSRRGTMMRSRFLHGAVLTVLALAAAACDSGRSTVPSSPVVEPARPRFDGSGNAVPDPVQGTPKDTIPRGPLIGSGNDSGAGNP
jgi:hypothetical protein